MSALLEILAITPRGISAARVKELERQMGEITSYNRRPGVDTARLGLLTKLRACARN